MDVTSLFREDFDSLEVYTPIKPLDVLAAEIGVPVEALCKLDANENLFGPVPEITAALATCGVYHIYPDPGQTSLRTAIAAFLTKRGSSHIDASQIVAGTGSDELLDGVLRLIGPAGIVNLPPTFGMYPFLAKIAGAAVVSVDRGPAPVFGVDLAGIAAAVAAGATVVFAASPNNPTGGMLTHAEVRSMASNRALIVIDEAYAEFAEPERSALPLIAEFPNIVVMRTFSKWAGLAGLRVGYAVASAPVAAALMSMKQPYNVSVAADVAAQAALHAADKIFETQVLPLLKERNRMAVALAATGWLVPMPTDANFVLFAVRSPYVASEVVAALRKRGVLVRYYPSGRLAGYLRVSAGRPCDTDRLLEAITEVSREQAVAHGHPLSNYPTALLFDMDGVLVDVASSYRAAIIATAAAFGATVSREAVDAAKAAGGANNDWKLTHRLIHAAYSAQGSTNTPPTLEEVTARFERFYQGDAAVGDPGLKSTETALISRADLDELRRRVSGRMAVVTGRPRSDAAEAIARFGWTDVFDTVVCMDDGPAKPNPEPVLLAIDRLTAASAARGSATDGQPLRINKSIVMLGDTVDDVTAAISAGITAFGVYPPDAAPGADAKRATALHTRLYAAGAHTVLLPGCGALLAPVAPLVPPVEPTADEWFAKNAARVAAWRASRAGTTAACEGPTSTTAASQTQPSSVASAVHSDATIGACSIGARTGSCKRVTKETSIYAWINLDGNGESDVGTG